MDEHYDENHAPMNCSLCKCTIERELWDLHTSIQCPQRMLACQYCEFELPAVDLLEHQDVCGNRTDYCQTCRKYIRLREWIGHQLQFHTSSSASAEHSSGGAPAAAEPKPAHGSHCKQLLLSMAIAGFAVLIGSVLYQRKGLAGFLVLIESIVTEGRDSSAGDSHLTSLDVQIPS
ncbi:unnamed protein product [Urochloa humidicola]